MNETKSILIVDDSVQIRTTCGVALRTSQWHVILAGSAEHALEILESEQVDLIFLDLKLPNMDGFTFLRTIRDQGHWLPVILITAHYQSLTQEEIESLGGSGFLPKPFGPEQLRIAATRMLADVSH